MNERDIEKSKELSVRPVLKRRSTAVLMPLITSQRNRITRQGYVVDVCREAVEEARQRGAAGAADLDLWERELAEALAGKATLEERLNALLAELDQ